MRAFPARLCGAALVALALIAAPLAPARAVDPAELIEQGRRIYEEGVLPSGRALTAVRSGDIALSGQPAACVACHKRSGLGSVEGDIIVPPVSGQALYAGSRLRERVIVTMDPRRGRSWNQSHPPYDEQSLLAAVRDGTHVTGRPLSPLMPRYAMDAEELRPLQAYLSQLSSQWSPGVTGDRVRLATVITPGIAPQRRDAFLKTLNAAVEQKNSNTMPGHRHMINAAEMMLHVERSWQVETWELQGDPATWAAQLEERYRRAPVFALVSGLADGTWEPVHDFCQRHAVPCWFPSVPAVPPTAGRDYYALYFHDGVELEAQVLANHLNRAQKPPRRVIEVARGDYAARRGAEALQTALPRSVRVERRLLDGSPAALAGAVAGLDADDALVLWLGPQDLAALAAQPLPPGSVYASTLLGAEHADLGSWRARTRLIYPYELPDRRELDMATFHSWIQIRSLPLVDEAMQSEVFFSISYLQYTLSEMLDNLYRDYLIERGETMLRRREAARAEEETMIRGAGHPPAPSVARNATLAPGAIYGTDPHGKLAQVNTPLAGVRQGTTIYPHLSLASGQRFASKGAYVARFTDGGLAADSDWIVPLGAADAPVHP